ncbi:MAG: VWA domain-containing protein [Candidatus Latescibacterota bacterium]|nr:MAG: VWA domain-containing protein [Candidatus Latescibacterota bacterium]
MFRFAYPQAFLLLLLLIPLVYYEIRSTGRKRSVAFSSLDLFVAAGLEAPVWKRYGRIVLRMLVLTLIIFGIARPQTGRSESSIRTEGVDIMLVLDTSSSMQAQDFKPKNRLHAAKEVVKEFIAKRTNDRIGLVVFSAEAISQCPLTLDYDVLTDLVDRVDFGMLEDGTAIGVALATACNRLKESEAESRVVVLLTDGRNNMGMVSPLTAAKVANSLGIKVYTIGVGTTGMAPVPVRDPLFGTRTVQMEVQLDEETLKQIADVTEGEYFRATHSAELMEIYDRIDELEKTQMETQTFTSYTDKFALFIVPALCLLVLELVLGESIVREFP